MHIKEYEPRSGTEITMAVNEACRLANEENREIKLKFQLFEIAVYPNSHPYHVIELFYFHRRVEELNSKINAIRKITENGWD